jgi:hypothetical protein
MAEEKRGGKREGAGRKPSGNIKVPITLYVEDKAIWPFGNKEKLKTKLYDFISSMGALGATEFKGITQEQNGLPTATSHTTKQALGIEKTFQQHMNHVATLVFPDDKDEYILKIKAASNLSDKQKDLLITNIKNSRF